MMDSILEQLASEDPEQRMQAIEALARSGDRRALKPLGRVYKTDPEPEVRKLALRAGKHLQKIAEAPPPDPMPVEMPPVATMQPVVRDREQAQRHYDRAFDLAVQGDTARAVMELGSAFYLNGEYWQDSIAANLAAELTGMPPQQAVQQLANPDNWKSLTDQHGGIEDESDNSLVNSLFLWLGVALVAVIFLSVGIAFVNGEVFSAAITEVFNNFFS